MAASREAKIAWLAQAMGVGVADAPGAAPQDAKGGGYEHAQVEGQEEGQEQGQEKFSLASIGQALGAAGDFVVNLFRTAEVTEAQRELNASVDQLGKAGLDTQRLKSDRADAEKRLDAAGRLTDPGARGKAVDLAVKRLEELGKHADALAKAAQSVMGDSKDKPDAGKKAAIYRKALEDHYGLEITIPEGMTNTHLDRVFDMMGTVPRDQTDHDKLKKLNYRTDMRGSGSYGGARINMGDFGDAKGQEDYVLDGKAIPSNSFDATTLHEMGHALDDKKGIMAAHRDKAGGGGWIQETLDSVVVAMATDFRNKNTVGDTLTPALQADTIRSTLSGTAVEQPDGVAPADWQKLRSYLINQVTPSTGAAKPWFKADGVDIGGRCYLEAYSGRWWSYLHTARPKTQVNNYQWRAPGEWFAEIYAITWLAKKPPPPAIAAEIADYMWKA